MAPGIISWRDAVKTCATYSRLHVLLGILDSCIKWEKSSENAVSYHFAFGLRYNLLLSVLGEGHAGQMDVEIFSLFSKKIGSDISCKLSPKFYFSEKKKKKKIGFDISCKFSPA